MQAESLKMELQLLARGNITVSYAGGRLILVIQQSARTPAYAYLQV